MLCSIRTSSTNNMNKLTLSNDDSVYLTEDSSKLLLCCIAVLCELCRLRKSNNNTRHC